MTKQERDAWTSIYRLYEEFAPALRTSATLDDDNELAGQIFVSALDKLRNQWDESNAEGQLLLLAGYDILDAVFKDAKKRCQPG